MASIVIVSIDDCERAMDDVPDGEDRMGGSPGLDTSFRNFKSFRKIVQFLKGVSNLHMSGNTVADLFTEDLFVFFLDDKYDLLKACLFCVVNGEVDDHMPFGIDRVDLFQAAVSASHSGCHDH